MAPVLGTASFEAPTKKKMKTYLPKLKEGNNVYRIIPPIFSCATTGEFQVKHKVHFGFRGVPDEDGKQRMRVFECPERGTYNVRTKTFTITEECGECKAIREAKNVLKTLAAKLIGKGMDPDLANQKVLDLPEAAEVVAFLNNHNMDEKYYLNVLTQDDAIGLLKIPRGTGKDLLTFLKDYSTSKKRDPVGVSSGLWINISREGKGRFSTSYKVSPQMIQKEVDGDIIDIPQISVLSEEILVRLEEECFDLHNLFTVLTCAQVNKMVESDYDPKVVDEVFEAVAASKKAAEEVATDAEEDPFSA